jgi:hypothetical protein
MDRDVQKDIKGMYDSVNLIDSIIQADKHNEQLDVVVKCNYQHLEIMMDKDWIIESGEDLTSFVDCVARAKAWLGE